MEAITQYPPLFYIGAALMAAAAIGAVAAFILLRVSGRRLRAQLEKEFGRKRR